MSVVEKEYNDFYLLCNRYKPAIREESDHNNKTNVKVIPVTPEDIEFAKQFLNDINSNINEIFNGISYFHIAVRNRHYELAELIITHPSFDFQLLSLKYLFGCTILHSLCRDNNKHLLKLILQDVRFDGNLLNISNKSYENRTLLHMLSESNNKDLIKLVVNNEKFTCLNNKDIYGMTALLSLSTKNLDCIKLITEHQSFNPLTLIENTVEEGWSPIYMSVIVHENFVYLLSLVKKYSLLSNLEIKNHLFHDKFNMSVFSILSRSDAYYPTMCELIKFIEENNMRDIVWNDIDDIDDVKLYYPGKKVFNLLKSYRQNPTHIYRQLVDNKYNHDYEPNYFLDFPIESVAILFDYYFK